MALPTLVKAARGRLVRAPVTFRPIPVEGDTQDPIPVDLDDPHWWRLLRDGDIVTVAADAPAVAVKTAPAASESRE